MSFGRLATANIAVTMAMIISLSERVLSMSVVSDNPDIDFNMANIRHSNAHG